MNTYYVLGPFTHTNSYDPHTTYTRHIINPMSQIKMKAMGNTHVHSVRSLCCRDTSCCLGTLLHEDSCTATVAALHSAFLPAAHPHRHLGAPPGHLLIRMFQTPPTVTCFQSCWFSSCSSGHLMLLSCRATEPPRNSWAVPSWVCFSFCNHRIWLEAKEQSPVRAQIPGPRLPLSASGPETTITPSSRSEGPGKVGWVPSIVHRVLLLSAPEGSSGGMAPLLPQLGPGREATQSLRRKKVIVERPMQNLKVVKLLEPLFTKF